MVCMVGPPPPRAQQAAGWAEEARELRELLRGVAAGQEAAAGALERVAARQEAAVEAAAVDRARLRAELEGVRSVLSRIDRHLERCAQRGPT
jgi:hypothetical protein